MKNFKETVIELLNSNYNLSLEDAIDKVVDNEECEGFADEDDMLQYMQSECICPNNRDSKLQVFKNELNQYRYWSEEEMTFEEAFEDMYQSIDNLYMDMDISDISEEEFRKYCLHN